MASLLLALLVKSLLPITHPQLSSFINNSAGVQVKVMTAKLWAISSSHMIKGSFYRNRNNISWSRQVGRALISISHPSCFSWILSLCPDILVSGLSPKTPAVPVRERVSKLGDRVSATLLARVEVNKPRRRWLNSSTLLLCYRGKKNASLSGCHHWKMKGNALPQTALYIV